MKNYKIGILGSKHWGDMLDKPIFREVEGFPPPLHPTPTRGNPDFYALLKYQGIVFALKMLIKVN